VVEQVGGLHCATRVPVYLAEGYLGLGMICRCSTAGDYSGPDGPLREELGRDPSNQDREYLP
jgi:hypothetical protein